MEVNTTENKTLEQDYRDLAGLLSNIVDSLPIYFFVKDTGDNFRYVYSSPLMNQLYGRYHNDVVGKTDFDLFLDPVVAQSFRDMDEEVVKTGKMQFHRIHSTQDTFRIDHLLHETLHLTRFHHFLVHIPERLGDDRI